MKILTALIIVLAGLSTVDATELQMSEQVGVHPTRAEVLSMAWNTKATENAESGQCKAVCMLPSSAD